VRGIRFRAFDRLEPTPARAYGSTTVSFTSVFVFSYFSVV